MQKWTLVPMFRETQTAPEGTPGPPTLGVYLRLGGSTWGMTGGAEKSGSARSLLKVYQPSLPERRLDDLTWA
jgi:hypothetical protein